LEARTDSLVSFGAILLVLAHTRAPILRTQPDHSVDPAHAHAHPALCAVEQPLTRRVGQNVQLHVHRRTAIMGRPGKGKQPQRAGASRVRRSRGRSMDSALAVALSEVHAADPRAMRQATREAGRQAKAATSGAKASCGCNQDLCGHRQVGAVHPRADLFQLPGAAFRKQAIELVGAAKPHTAYTFEALVGNEFFQQRHRAQKFMLGLEMQRHLTGGDFAITDHGNKKVHKQHLQLTALTAAGVFKLDARVVKALMSGAAMKAHALALLRPRADIIAGAKDRATGSSRRHYAHTAVECLQAGAAEAFQAAGLVAAAVQEGVVAPLPFRSPASPEGPGTTPERTPSSTQSGWRVDSHDGGAAAHVAALPPPAYNQGDDAGDGFAPLPGDAVLPSADEHAIFAGAASLDSSDEEDGTEATDAQAESAGESSSDESGDEQEDAAPLTEALSELQGRAREMLKEHLSAGGNLPPYAESIAAKFVHMVKAKSHVT
jgi:hypothetical protein